MDTFRQVLMDNFPTAGALLRRVAWVNQNDSAASTFSLAHTCLDELSPRGIRNTLIQIMKVSFSHFLSVQIFKSYKLKAIYELTAQLMSKIVAAICNTLVDMLRCAHLLISFRCTLSSLTDFSLCFCQDALVLSEKSGIVNLLSIGEHGKMNQSDINSYYIICRWQGIGFNNTGKVCIPIANHIASDSECFLLSFYWAVKFDFHITNFRYTQSSVFQKSPISILLRISKRIISLNRFESWITRFLSTFMNSPEEGTKGKIHTSLSILHCLCMSILQPRFFLFPLRQQFSGSVMPKRFVSFFPCISTYFQRLVINPTTSIKHLLQSGSLCFGWKQSVLKCLSHETIIPQFIHKVKLCVGILEYHYATI